MSEFFKQPDKDPPCKRACPAKVDVPRYIRLISKGNFEQALSVIIETNPFPGVCGYICPHPCEAACQVHHHHVGGSVHIKALKRYVADRVPESSNSIKAKPSGKYVTVVGSGPAGLTAAYFMAKFGHKVTVFEALPVVGGMMSVNIPEYRLPIEVLNKDLKKMTEIGIEFQVNTKVNSLNELLDQGSDAVLLAIGANRSIKLMVEGEDSPEVIDSLDFLKKVRLGKIVNMKGRVAVIGGGYEAIDSGRTALRLGAKEVTIISDKTRNMMQTDSEEVSDALYEGIRINFLMKPKRISWEKHRLNLVCIQVKEGEYDSGKRSIQGSEVSMDFNSIIVAADRIPDIPKQFGLEMGKQNTIKVSKDLSTNRKGVFAAGDVIAGPRYVINAIAAGHRAANAIDEYLNGNQSEVSQVSHDEELPIMIHGPSVGRRFDIPKLSLKERLSGFAVVELGLDEKMAYQEANRCLWCDLPILVDPAQCVGCLRCALMCSFKYEGACNPNYAKINIVPPDRSVPPGESQISFNKGCDNCGLCVKACMYGALSRVNKN